MTQKQTILGRVSQLAKANINALLDRAEDPEKMLDQLVRDYTNSIAEAEEAVAQTIAHVRMAEGDLKADQEAATAMAGIGAATNEKMADMLEAHGEHMVFARRVLEEKAKADERFARRFSEIVEKHDKNLYSGS